MADRNEILIIQRKACSRCGLSKPVSDFYKSVRERDGLKYQCKECDKKASAVHYRTNSEYRKRSLQRSRTHGLKKRYGISEEQYNEMFNRQNGVCAICKTNEGQKQLAVDHDHKTGIIRKLLCMNCNTAIGMFKDDPELLQAAISYLREHRNG